MTFEIILATATAFITFGISIWNVFSVNGRKAEASIQVRLQQVAEQAKETLRVAERARYDAMLRIQQIQDGVNHRNTNAALSIALEQQRAMQERVDQIRQPTPKKIVQPATLPEHARRKITFQ